mmetsp:Transcript_23062/g.72483  ORF Transcript_23062/g.72483 Transcript_23062/m.72483 type:complete len:227 (+) Transcript_23062:438-1118(+)
MTATSPHRARASGVLSPHTARARPPWTGHAPTCPGEAGASTARPLACRRRCARRKPPRGRGRPGEGFHPRAPAAQARRVLSLTMSGCVWRSRTLAPLRTLLAPSDPSAPPAVWTQEPPGGQSSAWRAPPPAHGTGSCSTSHASRTSRSPPLTPAARHRRWCFSQSRCRLRWRPLAGGGRGRPAPRRRQRAARRPRSKQASARRPWSAASPPLAAAQRPPRARDLVT